MLASTPKLPSSHGDTPQDIPGWDAPLATAPLQATVPLPGSKSLTNRELVLATLAHTSSTLHQPLYSRDTRLMIEALRCLGAEIIELPNADAWAPPDLRITPPSTLTGSTSIACGLAGTVMRFVPPLAALALGPTAFDGDPYARTRPMRALIDALRTLGADISDDGRGTLPFTVHGTGSLRGGSVAIDASVSSQFISVLLLAAPRFEQGVHIVHTGDRLPSQPHIEMTVAALRARSVPVDTPAPGEWRVPATPMLGRDLSIETDLSNAAPFLAAAITVGGDVTIPHWPSSTTQVGAQLCELLPQFGARISRDGDHLTAHGTGRVHGVTMQLADAGELAPTLIGLAALAAHGTGTGDGTPSRITGIGHIRHHETDRIAALVANLTALGGNVEALDDGIALHPATLHGGRWCSYADHRMATTGALLGLTIADIEIDDIACTAKTLPQFSTLWQHMIAPPATNMRELALDHS